VRRLASWPAAHHCSPALVAQAAASTRSPTAAIIALTGASDDPGPLADDESGEEIRRLAGD